MDGHEHCTRVLTTSSHGAPIPHDTVYVVWHKPKHAGDNKTWRGQAADC